MNLPTLYKKTNTGAIQFWSIDVLDLSQHSSIAIEYGQLGTDSPQKTVELIKNGKNVGRSNETSFSQQAASEANARWEKQVKKGYVDSLEKAKAGECDLKGVLPMLAKKFSEQGHKIQWPAMVQPKLDGNRCIAVVTGNSVKLYSRTRKLITSMKHIEHELLEVRRATGEDFVFDGELYNHDLKRDFEDIQSAVRTEKFDPKTSQVIQYHIYDLVSDKDSTERQLELDSLFGLLLPISFLQRVPTYLAGSQVDMMAIYDAFLEQGYEGAMVRQSHSPYQHKKTALLQKVKQFDDDEWRIVDIKEGRGTMSGKGIFACRMKDGQEFDAKLKGKLDNLSYVLEHRDEFIGKMLTVQYQGFFKSGKPRFPVGLRIREEE